MCLAKNEISQGFCVEKIGVVSEFLVRGVARIVPQYWAAKHKLQRGDREPITSWCSGISG
jgi:hypothetical protein